MADSVGECRIWVKTGGLGRDVSLVSQAERQSKLLAERIRRIRRLGVFLATIGHCRSILAELI